MYLKFWRYIESFPLYIQTKFRRCDLSSSDALGAGDRGHSINITNIAVEKMPVGVKSMERGHTLDFFSNVEFVLLSVLLTCGHAASFFCRLGWEGAGGG